MIWLKLEEHFITGHLGREHFVWNKSVRVKLEDPKYKRDNHEDSSGRITYSTFDQDNALWME